MEINHDVILALGSNSGKREENIQNAIELIRNSISPIIEIAENFENEAQGFESEILFLNTCIRISTSLSPIELLNQLKIIEEKIGRLPKNSIGYESRIIDIDIILFGDLTLTSKELTIPHLHFRKRDFVLKPLSNIAPEMIDPITSLSINQLLRLL